ncbi:LPS export ABC transporter permease LptG [Actibacterium sp. XHP0104]|uniref:LPS export ABC transporter permease LptG n=1 Tax=Actibacterium sp. XHP0104 TaxID=2984335 RepID=UPI0021E914F4|nr:LPS export ABC transporter permease LptG [Actibacterium sp. XHP0104]MCV2880797.1 LPS export ABC transporter permease LptG [Actibacterium sp. XHP0104]
MKLHLYFARKFAVSLLAVLAAFAMIVLMLDVVEQVRRFEIGTVTFTQLFGLSLLNTPEALYGILPLIVMLATLTLYLRLARSSELVVTRASGRSALQSLLAPITTALLAGGLAVAVFNPLVAATGKIYEERLETYRSGTSSALSITVEGLWLRQSSANGQTVIRAPRANQDGTVLFDVTFITFSAQDGPVSRIEAARAELGDGAWALTNAKQWDLAPETRNPERTATRHDTLSLPSDLTRERIRDSFGSPDAVPIWALPAFINDLEAAGFSARRHKVWFHMELALPLMFVAMVLLAAVFTMRHTRFGRTGPMVLMAFGLGLGLFFLRDFAQVMGENGQIPPELAAWSPPLVAMLLAVGLLLHLEDG